MALLSLKSSLRAIRPYSTRAISVKPWHFGPQKGDKVIAGMSGGVDSSVSALLLAHKGYDVSGLYMRNWDTRDESGTDKGCEWEKDWEDVQRVCKHIGIPCEMIDLSREYWTKVFEPSLNIWEQGGSPNPDVYCNQYIKFGSLIDRISQHSPDAWIAMGHYAGKGYSKQHPARPQLLRPKDLQKDQTYYLSSIPEDSLSRTLFPLSEYTKPELRQLAKMSGLHNADRKDSVGICFVGKKRSFRGFLSNYLDPNPGPMYDIKTGKVIAEHHGLWNYTIGENVRVRGLPERMFVARKDTKNNAIYVAPANHMSLYSYSMIIRKFSWIWQDSPPAGIDYPESLRLKVMYRYRTPAVDCIVTQTKEGLKITTVELQLAICPGQVAVLYDGDWCLGCGIIEEVSSMG